MRVYVFPADLHGCGHYRMIWPAKELIRRGHDVVLQLPNEGRDIQAVVEDDVVRDVMIPNDADVLVFQRVTHRFLAQAARIIRNKGVAVVIDMDDDLSRLDPTNPAFAVMHPKNEMRAHGEHTWRHAQLACDSASHVTTSTVLLQRRYARHGRGSVVHNAIHDAMFDTPHVDSDTFGYPGAVGTHYNDVMELGFSVAQLMREGHQFVTIGESLDLAHRLQLPRPADVELGPVTLKDWPTSLTRLGVGLAPLADTQFNHAKSWLKPLELAAVGVPCVMSPRTEYRRIHDAGIGLLARNPREFHRKTQRLLTIPNLRRELSEQGREVARRFTISKTADIWWRAWTDAYYYEQNQSTRAVDR
ncbi:MAG: hypothetical protein A2Y75_05335 [Candidatus Solincola sediminis]|uniref:Spore protein YkvP/CgeB glycosyl transferase-like domain-containing protein n=1 Tax=Candidatus Solincola sediminis TaxID=1797199 RepID=A0A1F2WG49_9ACTN|nr:MAG: hypothetical protein A2Y75_05335 [Candidatus Solincola sediminis]